MVSKLVSFAKTNIAPGAAAYVGIKAADMLGLGAVGQVVSGILGAAGGLYVYNHFVK